MAANSAPDKLLIYGATGYTGRLTAGRARAKGLTPVLAGRDAGRVQALAAELGFEGRAFALTDTRALHDALRDMACVLHMAGPFSRTSAPMLEACLEMGVHYVDITGEIQVFEQCAKADSRAKACGIMVLPGAGFEVVAGAALAHHRAGEHGGENEVCRATAWRNTRPGPSMAPWACRWPSPPAAMPPAAPPRPRWNPSGPVPAFGVADVWPT